MPSSNSGRGAALRVRLLWLTVFRTVATTLVLAGLGAQLSSDPLSELSAADFTSFAVIGFSFFVTLITALFLRRRDVTPTVAWLQIAIDVLLSASVIFLTGGVRSPFLFLFLVSIVGAAVLLGTRGAIVGFVSTAAAYSAVLATLPQGSTTANLSRVVLDVVIQLLAQLLIAVLSGYVGEQLSRTGGQLNASERNLESLTELQNEIVSAMPSGLITSDATGLVTYVNPAAESILGVGNEVRGLKALSEVLPGIKGVGPGRRSELRVQTSRGERILGLSLTPLRGTSGQLIVFQDLTELRRVEKELDRIDHLATLGRLSAQLAHEIRNPLAAMRGSAQMLTGDGAGKSADRLARLIVRESDRLSELVEGYLKLARPPPPQLVETQLDQVVRETLELLRSDPAFAAVPVEEVLTPTTALVDAAQLRQVLINLLRNAGAAVRASHGRVRIRVGTTEQSPVVEVWDSAGSIAEDDRQRIFEPFFSKAEGGSGLGLSTVHSIVQAHGGTITVASNPATGTTFSVKLRQSHG